MYSVFLEPDGPGEELGVTAGERGDTEGGGGVGFGVGDGGGGFRTERAAVAAFCALVGGERGEEGGFCP